MLALYTMFAICFSTKTARTIELIQVRLMGWVIDLLSGSGYWRDCPHTPVQR